MFNAPFGPGHTLALQRVTIDIILGYPGFYHGSAMATTSGCRPDGGAGPIYQNQGGSRIAEGRH